MDNTVAFLARFPLPSVAMSGVIIASHLILRIWGEGITMRLFMQPAYTVYHPQHLVTAGLFEDSTPNLVVTVLALLYCGKALQPEWSDREAVRFVLLVNILQARLHSRAHAGDTGATRHLACARRCAPAGCA